MNHTPGPWWVEKGDGDCTPKTMIYVCHEGTSCDETTICNFDTTDRRGNHDANARLIASAPVMLEALKKQYRWVRALYDVLNININIHPDSDLIQTEEELRLLIEHATGRKIEEVI